jgi:spore germination protein KC
MINLLRKLMVILLVFILLFTSGCWNRREMDTLTVNSALGFDLITSDGKSKILLSVLTLKPSPGASSGGGSMEGDTGQQQTAPGQVISITGDTIQDAVRNWGQRSSRQLFMGHTVLFVIGESAAKKGIGWVIDFGTRNRDIPERAMVVVCEGMARDFLQAQSEFEPLLSTEVFNILNQDKNYTSKSQAINIIQVMYDLLTPGSDPSLPFLRTITPPEKGSAILETPFGCGNIFNAQVLEPLLADGKPCYIVDAEHLPERDYTGGEVVKYISMLKKHGLQLLPDQLSVLQIVQTLRKEKSDVETALG